MVKKNIIEKKLVILVTIFLVTGSYISILSKSTVDASYPNEDIKEEHGGSQLICSNTDQPVSSNTQTNHFFEDEYAKVKINTGTPLETNGQSEVEDNGTEDDIEILTINYNETLHLLNNGTSEMDLSIVVPQSIYAEMYREMIGAPGDIIRGESISIPLNSTTVSSEKIIISAGRESFYNEIQKIHWYSFGTDISISDSGMIPVGDNDECTVNISGISVLDVNILDGDYWNVGFGPQSTDNLSAVTKYIASTIGFTKLMLNSEDGRQIYKQIWEIRLILPTDATLLNTENLDGKQWLLDFGGGTYLTANIFIENSSTILIKEILIVTEDEIIHPTPIGSYKSFEIEMIIPNSPPSINPPLLDNSRSIFEFRTDVINIVNYDETISLPGDYWDAEVHLILNLECQAYLSDSKAWVEANAYAYAGVQVTFNYDYEYSWDQEIFSSPTIFFWIGPVCIVIDAGIELGFSATAEIGATVSASAWADATIKAGAQYSFWDGFHVIWEHDFQKGYEIPSVSDEFINFQFTARPSVKFPISAKVYGIIGPEITPEICLLCTFIWTLNFGGQYDFFWNAKLGFTLTLSLVVGLPYIAEKSWDWEILDYTIFEWGNVDPTNPDLPDGIDDMAPETWLVMYSPPLYYLGGNNWVTGKYLFFWFEAIEQAGEGIPSGLDKTMFKVNGNPWMEYNYPDLWLAEINEDPGYYYYDIQWYSIDNLGNIEPTNTYQVNAELYPPTSSIDYPSGAIYAHETPITLEGTDDLTGWRIWYRVWYDDSWSEWTLGDENTPVTLYFYGNGENRVEWCAMDGVWNFESIHIHSFNVVPPSGQYFTFSTVGQSDLQEYDDGITGYVSFILSVHNKYTRVMGEFSSYLPNDDHRVLIYIWDESADEWIHLGSKLIVAGDSSWHAFDYTLPSIRSTWLFFSTNKDALTEVRNGCLYYYSDHADASLDLSIMCDWVDTDPESETYGDHGDNETNFDLGEKCWSFSEISNTAQWDVIKWKWKKDGMLRYTGEWTIPQPWNSVICWSGRTPDEAGDWIVEIFYNDDYLGSGPEFTVHGPSLSYAPDSIDFDTQVQGWTGYSTFDVWNDGPGTLTYTISEDIDWIEIGYYDGESNGEHDTIQINVINTGSMLGHYEGNITISSNGGSGNVTVSITIEEPAPELFAHPTQMYYTVRRDNSKTQQILVKNTGNIDIYWQIQNVSYNWIGSLTFDPSAGTTALGPSDEINVDVIVAVGRWADLGEWSGDFTVHAEGCTDITVHMDVDVLTKWEEDACFLAGTNITMANGSYKNIENIIVGDIVKSYNVTTSEIVNATVIKVYNHTSNETLDYYLSINNKINVTINHIVLINGTLMRAEFAKVGDIITGIVGENTTIDSIDEVFENVTTYNFEFSPTSNLYIADDMGAYALKIKINQPMKPSGAYSVNKGVNYSYSTSTTDIAGGQIFYRFDWGDGTNSSWLGPFNSGETVNASHMWNETGNYEIKVDAMDSYGEISKRSDSLAIATPLEASLATVPSELSTANEIIYFNDNSFPGYYEIVNWTWDFGDGNVSYEQDASHEYAVNGVYNVTLTVTDNQSNNDVYYQIIIIDSLFGYTERGSLSQTVHDRIAGSVFTANEYGVADNITAFINQIYMSPGPYKCMIYRLNDSKLIGTTTEDWESLPQGNPIMSSWWAVFNFTEPLPVLEKDTQYVLTCWGENEYNRLYYDISSQSDGRYDTETYGTPSDPANFSNENRVYSIYCSYTPTAPEKPTLWGPLTITENIAYTYNASTIDPDENASLYYQFDWGDDSELSDWIGPFASGATCNNATHTWTEQGYYDITVRAKDESGAISCWSDPLPIVAPFDDDPEPEVGISPSIHNIEDFQLEVISIGELNIRDDDVIESVTDVIDDAQYYYGAKIKNIGSTDIEGYLRTIVRYFDQISEQWITLNDPVNDTTPRTINSGRHLALGPIFKGRVHTRALTNGNGNYRVYAVFGDSDGNVLKCADDTYLVAKCEFTVTGL